VNETQTHTVFIGETLLATGPLATVLPTMKNYFDRDAGTMFLVFEDETGKQVDFDLRGTLQEVLARNLPVPAKVGPGRPSLGVVAREVTLLPKHWNWLEKQPNGASAALRRLVEQASKQDPDQQRANQRRDAAGRFLSAMAGGLPGYEQVNRAVYRGDFASVEELMSGWPPDIRTHVLRLLPGEVYSAQ